MGTDRPESSLAGKVALVTGATAGIGREACVKLARRGARVVMVARDPFRAQRALEDVRARGGSDAVEVLLCDFAVQSQIRRLACEFAARHDRLDLLINNAGSVNARWGLTVDGVETTFAVNHLGYFLLTNLLLDLLKKSGPARIVNVASKEHRRGRMNLDDLHYEKGVYFILWAYARSKLGNVLFTRELARRLGGERVSVNAVHPGVVSTGIWSHAPWFARPFLHVAQLFMISAQTGGDRILHVALSPELEGKTGGYYERNRLVAPSRLGQDDGLARRLWDISAQLVKLGPT
jgi:retinol dehydrogenase-14